MIVLVTGGARSGKSHFAEQYAERLGTDGIYIATAETRDEEMKQRVEHHMRRRKATSFIWSTLEVPLELASELEKVRIQSRSQKAKKRVILVDCLTLWLSNQLLACSQMEEAEQVVDEALEYLAEVLVRMDSHVLLVTNEVGNGIVPEYPLGRLYRDLAGKMNQRLATICDQVFLVTAGIPVELKSMAFKWEDSF